jgi:hypothetical protein
MKDEQPESITIQSRTDSKEQPRAQWWMLGDCGGSALGEKVMDAVGCI